MSTKKWIALLLAAVLVVGSGAAGAEEATITTFSQPEGVEVWEAGDLRYYTPPDGLQSMYDIMSTVSGYASAYVFIMPNGRALMSLSSATAAQPGSAQTLMDAWPTIALSLSKEAEQVNTDSSCISYANCFGFDGILVETTLQTGTAEPLSIAASGQAFYNGLDLIELWTVYPAEEEGSEALREDLNAMEQLKSSLIFEQDSATEVEAEALASYEDPSGSFAMQTPPEAVIITGATDAETVAAQREAYASFSDEGGVFFDQWMAGVTGENVTLVLLPEYAAALSVRWEKAESLNNDELSVGQQAAELQSRLAAQHGQLEMLSAGSVSSIAGVGHTTFSYRQARGETIMFIDAYTAMDEYGLKREVDLFTLQSNEMMEAGKAKAIVTLLSTLTYKRPSSQI